MATEQASVALSALVGDLKTWVSSQSIQRILNGKKGSNEALNLFAHVMGLSPVPTETDLEKVIQSAIQLNTIRKIFRHPHAFNSLQLRLICGRLCAKFIADGSISGTGLFDKVKVVSFKSQTLTEPMLVHRTGNSVNDLFYLDLDQFDRSKFEALLTTSGTTLPFQLVKALPHTLKNTGVAYAFVDESLSLSVIRVEAYIRALSLNQGKPFHTPKKYTGAAMTRNFSFPTSGQSLEQFNDVQQVLSECFREDDLLNRFLRLYQILENFMVRKQIVSVQRATGVRAFSIRDFRRLHSETETKEQETLVDLLKDALNITTLIGTKSLSQIVMERWDTEIHASSIKANLESQLLMAYGPSTKNGASFDTNDFLSRLKQINERHKVLGQFIYRFRNMIVHNKETEFHLTHSSMSAEIEILFNKFLIPSLDDIVFALLNIDQTIVWYPHPTISLYKS